MIYILIFVALAGIYTYVNQRNHINSVKLNGVRTTGIIIENKESGAKDDYRLGGNINEPLIQFTTLDGQVITGKPVVGFVTQYEIVVPESVSIVYNAKNPKQFYIYAG